MQSRFFTLASNIALAGLSFSALSAQTPGQSPTPPPTGYIRFWDMLPRANGDFELRKVDAKGVPETVLLRGYPLVYSSYSEFQTGKYRVAIVKTSAPKIPLKTFDLDLKGETFCTFLLAPKGGVQAFELIDDTLAPKPTSATLTVRNFFGGASVTVLSGGKVIADSLPFGQSVAVGGFALNRITFIMRTTLANGKPAESTAEADFTASSHATLLIIPDPYGRFRPRMTLDGKLF